MPLPLHTNNGGVYGTGGGGGYIKGVFHSDRVLHNVTSLLLRVEVGKGGFRGSTVYSSSLTRPFPDGGIGYRPTSSAVEGTGSGGGSTRVYFENNALSLGCIGTENGTILNNASLIAGGGGGGGKTF
jgi:hypothetical protein